MCPSGRRPAVDVTHERPPKPGICSARELSTAVAERRLDTGVRAHPHIVAKRTPYVILATAVAGYSSPSLYLLRSCCYRSSSVNRGCRSRDLARPGARLRAPAVSGHGALRTGRTPQAGIGRQRGRGRRRQPSGCANLAVESPGSRRTAQPPGAVRRRTHPRGAEARRQAPPAFARDAGRRSVPAGPGGLRCASTLRHRGSGRRHP
jgi:hypothetical protein